MAKDMKARVEEFADQLEGALGNNLLSLMLYGPAVRQEGTGTATMLLILQDAGPRSLRPIEDLVKAWTKKDNPPPLIFAEHEWEASADVFPIEIEDMREAHLLVRGRDPLQDIQTSREDLRHELEREIRGKLLQLRTEFAAAASDGKALGALLEGSARTFFVLFRAILRLVGRSPSQEPRALVQETAEVTGIDTGAFTWVLERMSGEKARPLKAHDPTGDRYLEQISTIAVFIDTFDATRPAEEPEGGSSR
jgi:hypothetical protein